MTKRIDAHQHYWRVERGDYHWMPESGALRHDYLPADLVPLNREAGIEGTILVQAAETLAESDFLLDLAASETSMVLGVIAWAPLDSDEAVPHLERYGADARVVSIRPMLHDLPDVAWITRPKVVENLRRIAKLGLRFDVLSYPEHLPYALQAVDQVPDLPVVIDHLSKPRYRPGVEETWRRWMGEFASRPQVCCKVSGMVTEVGPDWRADDVRAHVDFVLKAFGPRRVMFGSDWPVCLKVASHGQVVQLAEELTAHLSSEERTAVWGGTAARFYGV